VKAGKILQRAAAEAEPARRIAEIGVGADGKRPGVDRRAPAVGVGGGEGGRAGAHLHERADSGDDAAEGIGVGPIDDE
jgi:hypothetical protein